MVDNMMKNFRLSNIAIACKKIFDQFESGSSRLVRLANYLNSSPLN
jgi:hypothetical protein